MRRSFSHARWNPRAKGGGLRTPREGRRADPFRRGIDASLALRDFRKEAVNAMHKRMLRLVSALSLLAVLPAGALASPGRVDALNVPGDYIKDYTNIYTYVSGVNSVGNL